MAASHLAAFRGLKIFLTGHTGFKGAWLALWLRELGAEVTGFALPPPTNPSLFEMAGVGELVEHVEGDIRDFDGLRGALDECRPDLVFHLAAQALVRPSYESPKETFDANVGGSVNLLEAVRLQPSVRGLIYVTTDKCYHNNEWIWGYRENDPLGGRDPYSASKAAAEMAFAAYRHSYLAEREGLGAASVRAGNVIGGGDWALDRIIPDCMRALQAGEAIGVRNPSATRPWQHVLDPLAGYLQLAAALLEDSDRYTGSWNFGPRTDSVRSVGELVERVTTAWGGGEAQHTPAHAAPHEANLLQLNIDKAQMRLGWQPQWQAARAIQETVVWYRQVADGASPREETRKQIRAFMEEQS
ncbi:MAG: CDP-glucose 4,6-dehydratase [Magnetococcales bacterium]|nr:CDP-glucose 4,6-dehydratase [Magnetococcales bacterium]